jgi:uncharacterized protein (TIGR02569 family)
MLVERLRPVDLPSQVIHGDLSGNVLLHPRLPPAVIDLSPYWRPRGYASAIVLAVALLWHHADEQLIRDHAHLPGLAQLLLRALIFRLAVEAQAGADQEAHRRAVAIACELADSG